MRVSIGAVVHVNVLQPRKNPELESNFILKKKAIEIQKIKVDLNHLSFIVGTLTVLSVYFSSQSCPEI